MLSGIDEPSAGQVSVAGLPLFGISDDERTDLRGGQMGFIFQKFYLIEVLSAVENVEIPLLMQKMSADKARKIALEALEMVGLGDRANHRPAELSGGQQQRVAIARAFVHSPSVILCDEPTGNLDSATSDQILELLSELNTERNVTLVVVTHDDAVADRCERIIRMSDGRVIEEEE
jgi:putative ABC transport system ATP-binding protein